MTAVRTSRSVSDEQRKATVLAAETFELLRTRWALRALEALADGPVRFNQLQRELEPVRHKVLTATLRQLEAHRLVTRLDHETMPPRVDYALSAAGSDLLSTVHSLCAWSLGHLHSLLDEDGDPVR